MRRAIALLIFYLLPFTLLKAQLPTTPEGTRQPRILILLDGSSSMLSPWGKDLQRFTAAAKVVSTLMDSIYAVNNSVEFGLRVYGHTTPAQENNCTDTRREVMFSKNNATQMALRLASIHPLGVSPIAYSLQEAAKNDLEDDERNAYSIILITDGGESCGGDICGVMKELIQRKIFFKPYIIGLVDYAPLKDQYACLGTYLQATKEGDIPIAIKKITDDYRPMLTAPIMVASKPLPKPVIKQDVQVVSVPQPVRMAESIAIASLIAVSHPSPFTTYHYIPLPRPMAFPRLPKMKVETPADPVAIVPKPKPVEPTPKPLVNTTKPVVTVPEKDTAKTIVAIKPLPAIKPRPRPNNPPPNKPVEAIAITSVEDSKETTAAIYFRDRSGKFYHTSPSIQLLDAKTGKLVKEFYRTVGPSGEPDLQQLPPGTYNLMVGAKSNLITRNVVIEANKNNKIIIPASNGSINFVYPTAPGRAVDEFNAVVRIRFEPGAIVAQHCNEELPYPAGTYYVEVNTIPITRFSTEVDFGSSSELSLPEPGFLQITNRAPIGPVTFFYPLGDKYVQIPDVVMNVNGSTETQKLRLKPGAYEAHWMKKPVLPYAKPTIVRFLIKPNAVTEVELH